MKLVTLSHNVNVCKIDLSEDSIKNIVRQVGNVSLYQIPSKNNISILVMRDEALKEARLFKDGVKLCRDNEILKPSTLNFFKLLEYSKAFYCIIFRTF